MKEIRDRKLKSMGCFQTDKFQRFEKEAEKMYSSDLPVRSTFTECY